MTWLFWLLIGVLFAESWGRAWALYRGERGKQVNL